MTRKFSTIWHEFIQAATQPSLPALLGTLGVALTITILLVTLLTPDLLATKGYGYFLDSPTDNYAYLTSETLRISKTAPLKNYNVILMGASNIQEAVYADYLEQLLRQQTQQPINVYKLTAGGLFLWEEICILDRVREHFQGLVVLQIAPSRLALDRAHLKKGGISKHSRLALYCPLFDQEMRFAGIEPPQWIGNYFIDHYEFYIVRLPSLLRNLMMGAVQWSPQNAEKWRPPTQKQWNRAMSYLTEWQQEYHKYRAANFEVYRRLIQHLRERDIEIAFLEIVRNPAAEAIIYKKPEVINIFSEYQNDLKKFAQDMQVPYWDLTAAADLDAKDFIDHVHLKKPKARRRYTALLAQQISKIVPEAQMKEISE